MADPGDEGGYSSADKLTLNLFATFDTLAFVIASACVAALVMFLATAVLLVIGPAPGHPVGPHLSALTPFWPGFSVSWIGAIVGAFYAAIGGGLVGLAVAVFWNFTHIVIVGLAVLRRGELGYD
jgi:L-asparagine transporter-like permease